MRKQNLLSEVIFKTWESGQHEEQIFNIIALDAGFLKCVSWKAN
jgi:hypothetical protein